MKKKVTSILLIVVIAICSLGLVACEKHEHTYSDGWGFDSTHHWHTATCEHTMLVSDKDRHTLSEGVCSICEYDENTYDESQDNGNTGSGGNQGGSSGGNTGSGGNQGGSSDNGTESGGNNENELAVIGEVSDADWQRILGIPLDSNNLQSIAFTKNATYYDPSYGVAVHITGSDKTDFENDTNYGESICYVYNEKTGNYDKHFTLNQWSFFNNENTFYGYLNRTDHPSNEITTLKFSTKGFSLASIWQDTMNDFPMYAEYVNGKSQFTYNSEEKAYIKNETDVIIHIQFLEDDAFKISLTSNSDITSISYTASNVNKDLDLVVPQELINEAPSWEYFDNDADTLLLLQLTKIADLYNQIPPEFSELFPDLLK